MFTDSDIEKQMSVETNGELELRAVISEFQHIRELLKHPEIPGSERLSLLDRFEELARWGRAIVAVLPDSSLKIKSLFTVQRVELEERLPKAEKGENLPAKQQGMGWRGWK